MRHFAENSRYFLKPIGYQVIVAKRSNHFKAHETSENFRKIEKQQKLENFGTWKKLEKNKNRVWLKFQTFNSLLVRNRG